MPSRAPSLCNHPGCNALTVERYCDKHERERLATGYAKGKTTERGYGARWRKLRALVLSRDDYLCQTCKASGKLTPATEVDHVRAKAHGGSDDASNLKAICTPCHRAKTARERVR